ncbi:hypothetical protein [Streptomyces echinatus]|uniref:hypothetical protein n=1 Tax=Streptomyces echinatus TaxID=67293 RepID=UPI0037B1068E
MSVPAAVIGNDQDVSSTGLDAPGTSMRAGVGDEIILRPAAYIRHSVTGDGRVQAP